ncbi:lipopolysaccharide assembly protein LapA domain-containing protein [Paenibacillus filicis]|uniref:Lipopolysaccharide assembly protein LapA domain-containing protein n=1 Tax=Paenibacillus gyeongsangnamensis TaxID=3388067 RepID=A0ABT4Q5E1_9BACL|nr:lipopolysaccharide assembly protein LapA domain-containing protein [Paenibacillus filicis]MCZ8512056.1 lipopolysaccharide assembly protein LapA domain-containing protein [Paenibacillus filicis]
MRAQWIFIFSLVFALMTAVFAVINVEPVRVNFLFTETQIPLILVILGSTLLGGLSVGLFGMFRQFQLTRKLKQLEKALGERQGEAQAEHQVQASPSSSPAEPTERRANEI